MQTALAQAAPARFTLKQILNVDALTCTVFGLALVFGAATLAPLLGLPASLLFWAGVVLFPSAALMAVAAQKPLAALVWTVILGNAGWVVASLIVAFTLGATGLGLAFVLAQAAFVMLMMVLELKSR